MARLLMSILLVFLVFTITPDFSWAQNAGAPGTEEKAELSGTRKQLATIIFTGLAGAILGLSTLSFYGRPQDHLSNIAVGFAFGVITGTIFTTYKAATQPYDNFEVNAKNEFEDESFKRDLAKQAQLSANHWGWRWTF